MKKTHAKQSAPTPVPAKLPVRVRDYLSFLLKGIVLGASAILPGVSAGVLTVTFGLYQAMIGFLAHPGQNLRDNLRLFVPVGLGWVMGFLVFARLIALFFGASHQLAVCLFLGLILGTMPELFEAAGREGRTKACWSAFGVCLVLTFGLLRFFETLGEGIVQPNVAWFFVCGLLWGVSLVIPGMTFSSLLIFLGLYEPLNAGLADFNLSVLLPMAAGTALVVLLLAKAINHLFQRRQSLTLHCVLGVTFASTLAIVPTAYTTPWEPVWCLLLFAVGFAAVGLAGRLGFGEGGKTS